MKNTKIVCTIGPKSESKEILSNLVDAGMNVMRLNFSHGDHAEHTGRIDTIREIMKEKNTFVSILLDTKGPEIRTKKLSNGDDVMLEVGQEFTLTTEDIVGDNTKVSVTYPDFAKDLKAGDTVLLDDGLIALEVVSTTATDVVTKVINAGELGEKKGVNLPGVSVNLPALAEKDIEDIKFGCRMGVDYVAASFIRKASDVKEIRDLLVANGGKAIKIISKIENQEGLDNFEEILEASDGIMVARGDLGVEIPIEEVPMAQKMMIARCNEESKTVITATQMLDSMIKNPRPTRAEATDVANAVLDGTDAVMLSGETAKGKYPIQAVQTMARICERIDGEIFGGDYEYMPRQDYTQAIAVGAVETANKVGARLIVSASTAGRTIREIRKYFPNCPILCLTNNEQTARQVQLVRGAIAKVVDGIDSYDKFYQVAKDAAKETGLVEAGDTIIITGGGSIGEIGVSDSLKIDVI